MSKVITLRLSDEEYNQIVFSSRNEHRPISNFILHVVLNRIEESLYVDPIEMDQIRSDERLLKSLKAGHQDVKKMRGRFVDESISGF